MASAKSIKTVLLIFVLVTLTGVVVAYHHAPSFLGDRIKSSVPGLGFSNLDLGWHGILLREVDYESRRGTVYRMDQVAIDVDWWSVAGDQLRVPRVEAGGLNVTPAPKLPDEEEAPEPTVNEQEPALATSEDSEASDAENQREKRKRRTILVESLLINEGTGSLLARPGGSEPLEVGFDRLHAQAGPFELPLKSGHVPFRVSFHLTPPMTGEFSGAGRIASRKGQTYIEAGARGVSLPVFEQAYAISDGKLLQKGAADINIILESESREFSVLGTMKMRDLSLSGEGSFLGVPSSMVNSFLDRNNHAFEFPFKLEGNVNEARGYRDVITAAVIRNVIAILREDQQERIKAMLDAGDVKGAKREMEQLKAQFL